ncbi:hypothetical protein M378DRAFT_169423 [Amanita muscaria Koide BX008]|uniref:Uncharacterized protein n=1 Tax=Amanita muscaria (strain Koide BX008) TaxID=946122 RepID=A0A0C2WRI6_AMAMK|nr:hypothetical protein M378DRAFT_169423 [Amanita muscaria Koide BX008]
MADLVTTTINYGVPPLDGTRAWQSIHACSDIRVRDKNWDLRGEELQIENIRGKEQSFTLDIAGFQFYVRPTKFKTFDDEEKIKNDYYVEQGELIKELTGASKVVFFDHTIRRNRPGVLDASPHKRRPVQQAHVDQTTAASVARVHQHLPPAEAPELLKHRFQVINLWRPIDVPVLEWPLALCDYRSVDPKTDVFPVALVYPDREGETFSVKHNPNHQWKYVRGMIPDELVLIKCFDSKQDGNVAIFTPHTAFKDPTTPEGAPLRQSIELRALVFYD